MKRIINIIMLSMLLPFSAYGDMGKWAENRFQEIASRKGAVFFSQCRAERDSYSALLLFEAGSRNGFLIEMRKSTVTNIADVVITPDGLEVEESHGGVYTYARVRRLADEMAGYRFRFVSPFRPEILKKDTPTDLCINIVSDSER